MTKIKKGLFITAGVLFLTLAVVFFFLDLEISKIMVQDNPTFIVRLIEAIGEFPIYIAPVLFALVYGFTANKKSLKLVFHMLGLVIINVALIRLTGGAFEEFYNSNLGAIQYCLLSIAALLIYILLFMIFSKISTDKLNSIRDLVLLGTLVSLFSFILVTILKYIWGRPRFWSLSDNYSEYTNCLTIHGFSSSLKGNRNRSFPSGHTNSASCIMILSLIISRLNSKRWIKFATISLSSIYIILVATSRICIGAHYASDVLFGFGINCVCFTVIYMILKKKGWLHVRSNKC